MPEATKKRRSKIPDTAGKPLLVCKNRDEAVENNGETFKVPADGWFQIAKLGDWYHRDTGTMQVIDQQAIGAIVDAFKRAAATDNFPGLLVDRDHFSHDPSKPTEALCWISEMEARADGVWARGKWTSLGMELIEGGVYRLVSPVFSDWEFVEGGDGNRARPRLITRVALTNDPVCKGMEPISNRDGGGTPRVDAKNAAGARTMNHREELCRMLGLPVTASDEEIATAKAKADADQSEKVNRMNEDEKKAAADMKAEIERLKSSNVALLNRQVDSALETYAAVIGDKKEAWKARLNRDYDIAIEALKEIAASKKPDAENGKDDEAKNRNTGNPDKAGKKPVHNRDNGAHPTNPDATASDDNPQVQAAYQGVALETRQLMNRHPGMTYLTAYKTAVANAQAEGKIPPLVITKSE